VFFALQTFLGQLLRQRLQLFGRTYRVQAQADGEQRSQPDDVKRFYVRSDNGTMVPLSTLVSSRPINGPQYFERYNVYSSATINGTNAPGYSSGQAIAAMEELARSLPQGYAYEWSEATYQEKKTGGQTGYIFAVSLLFVLLVLAALYESWAMPVAILLVIPFGVFGAFLGLLLGISTTTSTPRSGSSCWSGSRRRTRSSSSSSPSSSARRASRSSRRRLAARSSGYGRS
jgi:multidrug efflux pump subunit AcrB